MDAKPLTCETLCGMRAMPANTEVTYWYQRNMAEILARELRILTYDPSQFGLRDDVPSAAVLRRLTEVTDQLADLAELVAGIDIDHDGRLGSIPARR